MMVDPITLATGLAATAGIAVAAIGGYHVGYRAATTAPLRLLRRAGKESDACLSEAAAAVDLAGRLCDAVADVCTVTERRIAHLLEHQNRLADALGRLRKSADAAASLPQIEFDWTREPGDPESGLPARAAFEANVRLLMASAKAAPLGGVLLIAVDDTSRLKKRIGEIHFRGIAKSIAQVLCRASRDSDLVCRIDGETFAVLMRDADPAEALAAAQMIRESFRKHPFRLGPDGPECLITASFGYTPVLASDELRLITDRARAAVSRSRRWGRNRLHAYDPAGYDFMLMKPPALAEDSPSTAPVLCGSH